VEAPGSAGVSPAIENISAGDRRHSRQKPFPFLGV